MAERVTLKADVVAAARKVEASSGVPAAVLLAVAIVETNAVAYAEFSGRREPLIRFEGHYFDRLLDPDRRARARAAGLADPKVGGVKNPLAQVARWRLLDRAAAIDPAAAFAARPGGSARSWERTGSASVSTRRTRWRPRRGDRPRDSSRSWPVFSGRTGWTAS